MDNQRLFLYLGLGFICLLIWQQWKLDEYEKNRPPQAQVEAPASVDTPAISSSSTGGGGLGGAGGGGGLVFGCVPAQAASQAIDAEATAGVRTAALRTISQGIDYNLAQRHECLM